MSRNTYVTMGREAAPDSNAQSLAATVTGKQMWEIYIYTVE